LGKSERKKTRKENRLQKKTKTDDVEIYQDGRVVEKKKGYYRQRTTVLQLLSSLPPP